MASRTLSITTTQSALLEQFHAALAKAERDMTVAFTAVLAAHDLATGDFVGISGPPDARLLEIQVPDTA